MKIFGKDEIIRNFGSSQRWSISITNNPISELALVLKLFKRPLILYNNLKGEIRYENNSSIYA